VSGNYASSSPDGIYFGQFGCLYTVGNNKVYRLASDSGWVNATVLETVSVGCVGPTAIAWDTAVSSFYVSCAHGFDGGPYAIEMITFAAEESALLCHTSSAISFGVSSLVLMLMLSAMTMV